MSTRTRRWGLYAKEGTERLVLWRLRLAPSVLEKLSSRASSRGVSPATLARELLTAQTSGEAANVAPSQRRDVVESLSVSFPVALWPSTARRLRAAAAEADTTPTDLVRQAVVTWLDARDSGRAPVVTAAPPEVAGRVDRGTEVTGPAVLATLRLLTYWAARLGVEEGEDALYARALRMGEAEWAGRVGLGSDSTASAVASGVPAAVESRRRRGGAR
jgi:hypothetical protein